MDVLEVDVSTTACFPPALHLVRTCSHAELRALAATYGVVKGTATMRKHELAEIVAPRIRRDEPHQAVETWRQLCCSLPARARRHTQTVLWHAASPTPDPYHQALAIR